MDQRAAEWPPVDLVQFLDQPNVSDTLNTIKELLVRRGFSAESVVDVMQTTIFDLLEDHYKSVSSNIKSELKLNAFHSFDSQAQWVSFFVRVCETSLLHAVRHPLVSSAIVEMMAAPDAENDTATTSKPPSLPPGVLGQLELRQRAVFILLKEGFSQAEISKLLKVSPARVSQLKTGAITRLRAIVANLRNWR